MATLLVTLDVLAKQVGILGIFSNWAATVTYFANCMGSSEVSGNQGGRVLSPCTRLPGDIVAGQEKVARARNVLWRGYAAADG